MKVWIYRPDREAQDRKINRNYVYDCNNKPYWDCFDEEKERRQAYLELLKKKRKEVGNISVSVPYE